MFFAITIIYIPFFICLTFIVPYIHFFTVLNYSALLYYFVDGKLFFVCKVLEYIDLFVIPVYVRLYRTLLFLK